MAGAGRLERPGRARSIDLRKSHPTTPPTSRFRAAIPAPPTAVLQLDELTPTTVAHGPLAPTTTVVTRRSDAQLPTSVPRLTPTSSTIGSTNPPQVDVTVANWAIPPNVPSRRPTRLRSSSQRRRSPAISRLRSTVAAELFDGHGGGMHLELVSLGRRRLRAAIGFFVDKLRFELVEDSAATTNAGRPKRWGVVRPQGVSAIAGHDHHATSEISIATSEVPAPTCSHERSPKRAAVQVRRVRPARAARLWTDSAPAGPESCTA